MATVTGLTAARMQEIIDATITDANVVGDNLILTLHDGSTVDCGNVRGADGADGADGATGPPGSIADLANLSGDTPNKIIWDRSGVDAIELYGLVTPAGFAPIVNETFDANPTAWPPLRSGVTPFTTFWDSPTKRLITTNNLDGCGARNDLGSMDDQTRLTIDFIPQASGTVAALYFSKTSVPTWTDQVLGAMIRYNSADFWPTTNHFQVLLSTGDSSGSASWNAANTVQARWTVGILDTATTYRFTVTRNGNDIIWELKNLATNTVIGTQTWTIKPAAQAAWGAGVGLDVVGALVGSDGGGGGGSTTSYFDNLTIQQQQPEQRDLMLAITPVGGTRTTKKIFGAKGPSTFLSDYAPNRMQRAILWRNAASASVANNTGLDVTWDSALSNADSMWSSGTNPDRITCVKAGLHRVEVTLFWSTTGGTRETTISHYNSAGTLQRSIVSDVSPGAGNAAQAIGTFEMAIGDYIKINGWQQSGASSTFGSTDKRTNISVVRISD